MRRFLFPLLVLVCVVTARSVHAEATFRLAFGSCVAEPVSEVWSSIRAAKPDLFLMLGDNIYQGAQDFGNVPRIVARYDRLGRQPDFARLRREVETVGIWDDHDFGPNDSDSTFAGRAASLAGFRHFFPRNPKPPSTLADSVAFAIERGPVTLIALDARSFRVNARSVPAGREVMFGEAQLAWAEGILRTARTPFVVLAAGGELLASRADPESLAAYPEEGRRLRTVIERSPATVIVISGDRHYAEILRERMGEKLVWEISSSPLSASFRSFEDMPINASQVALLASTHNFGWLEFRRKGREPWRVTAEIRDDLGRKALTREVFPHEPSSSSTAVH